MIQINLPITCIFTMTLQQSILLVTCVYYGTKLYTSDNEVCQNNRSYICSTKRVSFYSIVMLLNIVCGTCAFIISSKIRNLSENFHEPMAMFYCLLSSIILFMVYLSISIWIKEVHVMYGFLILLGILAVIFLFKILNCIFIFRLTKVFTILYSSTFILCFA